MLRRIPLHPELYGEHVTVASHSNSVGIHSACSEKQIVEVTSVLKRVHGGSQGALVRCSDGKLYILKLNRNPQGLNVLANEWIGAQLLQHLNFSIPPYRCVFLSKSIISTFPSLRFDFGLADLVEPPAGLHFASEFLESTEYTLRDDLLKSSTQQALNADEFVGMYVFDVWANHQDLRQVIYRQHRKTRASQALFIDNGHLFGGPSWDSLQARPRLLRPAHAVVVNGQVLKDWVTRFQQQIPECLREAIKTAPTSWYVGDITALRTCLLYRLLNLDTMLEAELNSPARPRRILKLYDS